MMNMKKQHPGGQGAVACLAWLPLVATRVLAAWETVITETLLPLLCWWVIATPFFCLPANAQEPEINGYAGSLACQPCHEKEFRAFQDFARKGRSYSSVEKMEKGLPPEKIRQCYACHTTGYGRPGGFIGPEQTPELKNAGCEVCHGPGKLHIKTRDPARIKRTVSLDVCRECHTAERVQAFRYKPILYAGSH